MWRLYQPLKWLWAVAFVGVAASLSASALDKILFGAKLSIAPWGWVHLYRYGAWFGLLASGLIALTLVAARSYARKVLERQRLQEFLICKRTNELLPTDFGYQSLNVGEVPNPHYRPYHQIYIQ